MMNSTSQQLDAALEESRLRLLRAQWFDQWATEGIDTEPAFMLWLSAHIAVCPMRICDVSETIQCWLDRGSIHCSKCGERLSDDDHRWSSARLGLCRECAYVDDGEVGGLVLSAAARRALATRGKEATCAPSN